MSDWLNDANERKLVAEKQHEKYRKDRHNKELTEEAAELERIDNAWKAACDRGKSSGKISLCWLDLKHISHRIYTFHEDYGCELRELILDGLGLYSLEDISAHCQSLEKLSLASNCIQDMSNCNIHDLQKLMQLNLLRNQLKRLPSSICYLHHLSRLDIANNELLELPAEISSLCGLKDLNLECNQLAELPDSFGKLRCEVVNLNSNCFFVCPPCIVDMKNLRHLSIMGNEIGCLPTGMHKLKMLEILRASKNRILILPDSLVDLTSLRCLWLDFNKLSALPPHFHRLTRLKELKMEGNIDLVYPPIDTIFKGTEEVLRWSRNRSELGKTVKIRHIIQSLEEILNQVQRHRIGGTLHESVFGIVDEQFQFPPDALWSIFLPELSKIWCNPNNSTNEGLKSFPYERTEVEQAMFQFRDAAGPIVKMTAHARFRRCSCMKTRHSTVVCVPPKIGWMCTRPALMMRRKICYEKDIKEKRRLLTENTSIDAAERAATNIAISFLASEEGILMIRNEAMKQLKVPLDDNLSQQLSSSILGYISTMGTIISRSLISTNHRQRSTSKMSRRKIEDAIRTSYVVEEVTKRRNGVIDRNRRVRCVMQSWMGLTIDDAFAGWRECLKSAQKQRRRERRAQIREERLEFEDSLARYEYEKMDVSCWHEQWDKFNEVPVWVHSGNGQARFDKPSMPAYPLIPKSLINMATGELFSQKEIHRNESDSISDNNSDEGSGDNTENIATSHDELLLPKRDVGLASEIDIAMKRVLEIQRLQVRREYKI